MRARRKVFLYKVEGVKGTDAAPTSAADLILPNGDITIAIPTEQDSGEGDVKGTFGPGDSVTIKQAMSIDLNTRVRGLGQGAGALLVPSIHAALLASGHVVVTAGSGVGTPRSATYTPSSAEANLKSATGYYYEDGLLYKLLGCANGLSFEASMNALTCKFTPQAKYSQPTVVVLPAWAAPAQKIFRMTTALMTMNEGGSPVNIGAFSFDTGTKVEEAYEVGNHYFEVADRNPVITIDPLAVASTADFTALTNCSSAALVATFTNELGETLVFTANKCVPMEFGRGARAGRITSQKKFSLKETAGDDQYSIAWTAAL